MAVASADEAPAEKPKPKRTRAKKNLEEPEVAAAPAEVAMFAAPEPEAAKEPAMAEEPAASQPKKKGWWSLGR